MVAAVTENSVTLSVSPLPRCLPPLITATLPLWRTTTRSCAASAYWVLKALWLVPAFMCLCWIWLLLPLHWVAIRKSAVAQATQVWGNSWILSDGMSPSCAVTRTVRSFMSLADTVQHKLIILAVTVGLLLPPCLSCFFLPCCTSLLVQAFHITFNSSTLTSLLQANSFPDRLVMFVLQKLENSNERSRVGSLAVLRHLINSTSKKTHIHFLLSPLTLICHSICSSSLPHTDRSDFCRIYHSGTTETRTDISIRLKPLLQIWLDWQWWCSPWLI